MPRDFEVSLCMNCPFRPIDPVTGKGVEGGLNITERVTNAGRAVVIYSVEDPRIHEQFGVNSESDSSTVVRIARSCTPVVNGIEPGLGNFDHRIETAMKNNSNLLRVCGVGSVLFVNNDLPEGLLYQAS